jgi:hypothetical protein
MTQHIKARRYERRFSTERAGASGRAFASERLRAFVRPKAPLIALTLAVIISFGALVFVLPSRFDAVKGFAFGAWSTFVLMYAYHWFMIASGASQSMMGEQGEVWTDEALQPLRKRGWRVVNHLTLKHGDIDHVAIGPGGLMVIESKWTSSPMALDGTDRWVGNWADQARRNTDDVKRFIGWGARADAPISPLLVIWGPQVRLANDEFHRADNGVTVIAGKRLRQALDDLADERTDRNEIERAYLKLVEHTERRDRADVERNGPRPRSAIEIMTEASLLALTGLASMMASAFALRLPLWAWAPAAIAFVIPGIVATRRPSVRRLGVAWLAGFGTTVVLLIAVIIINLG